MDNIAYIDNQNLYMATRNTDKPWHVDMQKLRVYLREKYHCKTAYLFMGAYEQRLQDIYMRLQGYGYILVYREHSANLKGRKKGNVDVDIVFQVMRDMRERDDTGVVLISGDGDYKRMVDYIIMLGRFDKILLPNRKFASSLYKSISRTHYAYLDSPDMRVKIGRE
jgi:uncharacterized LabA/DUF88 family protein